MKVFRFYGFILILVCLFLGFGIIQAINLYRPSINSDNRSLVSDLRQLDSANNLDKSKIIIPNDIKAIQVVPNDPKAETEVVPKVTQPAIQNMFERGDYNSQNNAYRI